MFHLSGNALADMKTVRLIERAQSLLDSVVASGEDPTETTILFSPGGSMHLVAESDWPLESLAREHGADCAFRISKRHEAVRVEGQQGTERCLLERRIPMHHPGYFRAVTPLPGTHHKKLVAETVTSWAPSALSTSAYSPALKMS